jgi:hypothetical protein
MNRERPRSSLSIYSGSSVNVSPIELMSLHIRRCKICDVILNEPRIRLREECNKSNRATVIPAVTL